MAHRIQAELLGTFVLVFFGVGSAVYGIDTIGRLGVAFTFGLVLLALAYAFGPVSGCHVNPAVTLAVLLNRGIRGAEAAAFMAAQLVGGTLAGGALSLMVRFGGVRDQTGGLGTNGYGETVNLGGALSIEIAMTALLVTVILLTTRPDGQPAFAGLAIGLTLGAMVAVGIPLTGASLNPARSLGPALFYAPALAQVWLFIVAPALGAALAVGLVRLVAPVHRHSTHPPVHPHGHPHGHPAMVEEAS
jgi:MIP family channel proteins